jgi:hypothetical protein
MTASHRIEVAHRMPPFPAGLRERIQHDLLAELRAASATPRC